MDILGAITAIKQTLDITKELRGIDARISDAEFKLRIADLVERLLEVREALSDAQEREFGYQAAIGDLNRRLSDRGSFSDEDGLLYKVDQKGTPIGEPYCNQCYVKDDKLFRLQYGPYHAGSHKCSNCNQVYGSKGRSSFHDPLVKLRRFGEDLA